jgi:hypothetical protein
MGLKERGAGWVGEFGGGAGRRSGESGRPFLGAARMRLHWIGRRGLGGSGGKTGVLRCGGNEAAMNWPVGGAYL